MNTADNVIIREKLASSYERMNQGASFSDAFAATGLFDNQIENLIITGQHSGEIVESLDRAAEHYQEAVYDATLRTRRVLLSMGLITMLVLGGTALAFLEHGYFQGMFKLTDPDANFLPLF